MKYRIEKAKSSRATCKNKKCKQKIPKDQFKLCSQTVNPFSPSGKDWKAYCKDCGLKMLNEDIDKLQKLQNKLLNQRETTKIKTFHQLRDETVERLLKDQDVASVDLNDSDPTVLKVELKYHSNRNMLV